MSPIFIEEERGRFFLLVRNTTTFACPAGEGTAFNGPNIRIRASPFGIAAAIQCDDKVAEARGRCVCKAPCDQLFTGAGFTGDQHRDVLIVTNVPIARNTSCIRWRLSEDFKVFQPRTARHWFHAGFLPVRDGSGPTTAVIDIKSVKPNPLPPSLPETKGEKIRIADVRRDARSGPLSMICKSNASRIAPAPSVTCRAIRVRKVSSAFAGFSCAPTTPAAAIMCNINTAWISCYLVANELRYDRSLVALDHEGVAGFGPDASDCAPAHITSWISHHRRYAGCDAALVTPSPAVRRRPRMPQSGF
ncbi:hypothetical protein FQR65_LT20763 [Abscondita terminalis]|nr:hypothetical protein FQR65_LT20763 [Abscondita terminalis]